MGTSQQTGSCGEKFQREQYFKPKLYRKFQLHKSTCLGLVIPQNLQLEIYDVGNQDNVCPTYRTSTIQSMAQTVYLPPPFQIYAAQDHPPVKHTFEEESKPLAEVLPPRFNWLTKNIATIRLFKYDEKLNYENEITEDRPPFQDWSLRFEGWDRHINLISPFGEVFTWKNSKHITRLLDDTAPQCHGNLKLETADGQLLAAWKQRRDSKVMGSIHVFEESRNLLSVQVIVASALCMALQQKCSGVTYFVG